VCIHTYVYSESVVEGVVLLSVLQFDVRRCMQSQRIQTYIYSESVIERVVLFKVLL